MRRTISIIGYRRPALFETLLQSLVRNDLAGWHVEIQIEPSDCANEFIAIAARLLRGHSHAVRINDTQLGVAKNSYTLLDRLFSGGAELNIYLEEDIVVSPDICALADWYAANHRPHWLCLSLLSSMCGSAGVLSDPRYPELFFETRSFNSLGFVVRRQEWDGLMRRHWFDEPDYLQSYLGWDVSGWDWCVFLALVQSRDFRSVQPVAARALHTGREGGVNCKPAFHDLAFGTIRIHEGGDVAGYRVVETQDLPDPARGHAILSDELIRTWKRILAERRNQMRSPGARTIRALARLFRLPAR